jgi:hypothetical protein
MFCEDKSTIEEASRGHISLCLDEPMGQEFQPMQVLCSSFNHSGWSNNPAFFRREFWINAISSIAGNVDVSEYGQSGSAWLITSATQNTALSFLSDSYTLFPTSSIIINDRKLPEPGVFAQQIITLIANPYVFSDSFNAWLRFFLPRGWMLLPTLEARTPRSRC